MSGTIRVNFTDNEAYASLCVFEWLMERWTKATAPKLTEPLDDVTTAVMRCFTDVGWTEMRYAAMRVGCHIEEVYKAFNSSAEGGALFDDIFAAFDWEFVPAVCARLDWAKVARETDSWKLDVEAFVASTIASYAMNLNRKAA